MNEWHLITGSTVELCYTAVQMSCLQFVEQELYARYRSILPFKDQIAGKHALPLPHARPLKSQRAPAMHRH